ncbi:hypothetical protein VTJ83DRAFT_6056 [Remersonia thermophila]|uniref:F-box domain-containing protein n=1 Tax=Remersonia thermophila TaxID=72144 RepID=A0ABR4D9J9_9PEZI
MSAHVVELPNEILIAIIGWLPDLADLAALSRTCRRLHSATDPELFARIPRSHADVRHALFYFAENGLIEPVRRLLDLGVNPNILYCSPVPRNTLLGVLCEQDRCPGRMPLIDGTFVLHYICMTQKTASEDQELSLSLSHICDWLWQNPPRRLRSEDDPTYNFLLHDLHTVVSQHDVVWNCDLGKVTMADGSHPPESLDAAYLWTPLHVAAANGDDNLAELLLSRGAAVDPFLPAHENPPFVGLLEIDRRQPWQTLSQSPLFLAVLERHASTVDVLLSRHATTTVAGDPFQIRSESVGITALHVAAWVGDLNLCTLLLNRGPGQIKDVTEAGLTPVDYALVFGNVRTVGRLLLETVASEYPDSSGSADLPPKSPLQVAAERRGALAVTTHFRRCSETDWLMDMGVTAGWMHETPVLDCLNMRSIMPADERMAIKLLRRLIAQASEAELKFQSNMDQYLTLAAEKRWPQMLGLLLDIAKQQSLNLSERAFEDMMNTAAKNPDSPAAVETIKLLIDHGVAAAAMPLPTLAGWFCSSPCRAMPLSSKLVPRHQHLNLTRPAVAAAQLAIAQFLYQRLSASPGGVQDEDLRAALMAVCQPGALPLCQWLASVGALRLVTKHDLKIMLFRTAMSEKFGGNDPELACWVLEQADRSTQLEMLRGWDVGDTIVRSQGLTVAAVLLISGAPPVARRLPSRTSSRDTPSQALFSCRTQKQVQFRRVTVNSREHPIILACLLPDTPGAPEVLQHALAAEKEKAQDFATDTIYFLPAETRPYPLASLVCCARTNRGQTTDARPSEPQRLAMLEALLASGADVHDILVERDPPPGANTAALPDDGSPGAWPSEPLWRALAAGDEAEIARLQDQQQQQHHPSISENPAPPRWKLADVHRPVTCAINSHLPSLVKLMLEERPLAEPNSPVALRYLRRACSGHLRLCPETLEIVLDKANIDNVDLPTGRDGMTALMCLMQFALEDDFSDNAADIVIHPECRCDEWLIGFEKYDLCRMVEMLVSRGARWTTRNAATGETAGSMLWRVVNSGKQRKGVYKIHVVEELRRRVRTGDMLVERDMAEGALGTEEGGGGV